MYTEFQLLLYRFILLVFVISVASCRKKPDPVSTPVSGSVNVEFENVIGSTVFKNNEWYKNHLGDSFLIYNYKYYITNIKLTGTNGTEYTEEESYHLVMNDVDSSKKFSIKNIPAGEYTKITFLVGVDSTRNVSGAQEGALDPINGMFWDWSTGYLAAQMDGLAPSSSAAGMFSYHVAGFKGPHSVLRWVTLDFPRPVSISKTTAQANLHITADIAEWFKNPVSVSFRDDPYINLEGAKGAMLADNYKDMFRLSHID